MKPKVIVITNQKGGSGKTTLSALLAYGLAYMHFKVLLIDLDPQAHLSAFFVKVSELDKYNGSIHMARNEKFRIIDTEHGKAHISIVPSNLRYIIDAYRGLLPSQDPFAIHKRIVMEPKINQFDYIICDTPPELFAPTIWGLYAADYIIIPINNEELSILGARLLIKDILPEVLLNSRREPKVLGLALINVTMRISRKFMDKLNDKIKVFIRNNVPAILHNRFYIEPLFSTIIHRFSELKDLVYRPKRRQLPLFRIIERNPKIIKEVTDFASEVVKRVNGFQGLQ